VLECADASCAWLAKPEGEDFARVVLEVLSNPAQARAKCEKARSVAERHDWRKVSELFFDTYDTFHTLRPAR
jgi:glycosyltransferase involved in cell wall biosynthesis